MKGIVLAGGTGSRLFPLTKVTNKHLLPVGHYPMIFHPIARLAECDITEILIVTGTEHMGDIVGVLGSGHDLGLEFTYKVQDAAGGIAEALGLAERFVGVDQCVVILGDNIFEQPIAEHVAAFSAQGSGARVLLQRVPDPERFGVATVEDGRIVKIVEKPAKPESDLAVTGIYMYGPEVFEIVRGLEPSARGELEITDVNSAFVNERTLAYSVIEGSWTDAGTFESLAVANRLAEDLALHVFEHSGLHGQRQ